MLAFLILFLISLFHAPSLSHESVKLTLSCPNALIRYRNRTFSIKEPETLTWIDSLSENDTLWDIGANIGLYSCYAASKNIRVFAFEPSYLNIHTLVSNVFLNNLSELITIVPIPCRRKYRFQNLIHVLRVLVRPFFFSTVGYDGQNFLPSVVYTVPGLTIDVFAETFPFLNHLLSR